MVKLTATSAAIGSSAWMFAQQGTDSLSGGAGWVGAGLLGAVLGWLLLKHLPDKDKQIDGMIKAKDEQLKQVLDSRDEMLKAGSEKHSQVINAVVDHCREESEKGREAAQRYHSEAMAMLSRLYDGGREAVHATRNLAQTIANRTQLADAFQSIELAAWTKGLDGTIISWNLAAERLLGWKQAEMAGKDVTKIIPQEFLNQEKGVVDKIVAGEIVDEYQTERMAKGGRRVSLAIVTSPIRNRNGQVVAISSIAREV